MIVIDVYLENETFNPVCNATIPGAWIAIVNGCKQAFARPYEFNNTADARAHAETLFK